MWIIVAFLFPPLIPILLLLSLFDAGGGGFHPPKLPKAPKGPTPPVPADPFLFRPVNPASDDAFIPPAGAGGGVGVEAPGALCLLCGLPKAVGDHDHGGL